MKLYAIFVCLCNFYLLNIQQCQIWFLLRTTGLNRKGRLDGQKVCPQGALYIQVNHFTSSDRIIIYFLNNCLNREGAEREQNQKPMTRKRESGTVGNRAAA